MRRRATVCAGVFIGLCGCFGGEFENGTSFKNEPVEVPQQAEASVAVAARVDQVGRQLLAQNPFLGIEPTFHTLGRKEPEIFHRDAQGVFVTEGLVQRCASDKELAAVLASELGKMSAARRIADRMRVAEPLAVIPNTSTLDPGGIGSDQNHLGVQAVFDQQLTRPNGPTPPSDDPKRIAEDILRSAGHEPKVLDDVSPILADAARNSSVARQLGTRGDQPHWSP